MFRPSEYVTFLLKTAKAEGELVRVVEALSRMTATLLEDGHCGHQVCRADTLADWRSWALAVGEV